MIAERLFSDLQALFSTEQVQETAVAHPLGNGGEVTVYPTSEAEIAAVLTYANQNGYTVSIMGAGTKRGFGGLVQSADILLSLSRYKGIVEHVPGDMTVTVKAGTSFKELQDHLATYGQQLSLDPSWPETATIGGIVAANDSGPKRLGYGSCRDVVIGMTLVYADGQIIRSGGKVVKNVAGYDMNKLFIGSMGTLAVMSEITLKLRPLPKCQSLVVIAFPEASLIDIRSLATQILDSMLEPVSLQLMSPSLSRELVGEEAYCLAIALEDVESSVRYQEKAIQGLGSSQAVVSIKSEEERIRFWHQLYRMGVNGSSFIDGDSLTAVLKVGVKNLDALKVVESAYLLTNRYDVRIRAHGGIGHGLCQIEISGGSKDILGAIVDMRKQAHELKGYVVVTHAPLVFRQQLNVWGEKPSHFFLYEGIKSRIDPNKMLNHKRFVGGI
ncbi:FAD-binding oxidoreductase [Priestia flexa]|uniref:FAD-binding oxidoreductase n=1 Tax=Priestia flexa TaxID=86664 RepID=UPI000956E210|nr:FAD-binding oxidoreductase [Priestia flexa]MBY6086540.1 FAD-binding oxidoreductase [Priestia flexa]SIQ31700.1 glycolate oxidase FAD binding subunit [Priestia flexa]